MHIFFAEDVVGVVGSVWDWVSVGVLGWELGCWVLFFVVGFFFVLKC